MSCQGPAEAMPDRPRRARRGEVMLQLSVSDLVSLAVNTVQNGWSSSELPLGRPDCQRSGFTLAAGVRMDWPQEILDQVYTAILIENRDAAAQYSWRQRAE